MTATTSGTRTPNPSIQSLDEVEIQRVARTPGTLYAAPRAAGKRRRCDGHLTDPHWIEVGDQIIWSALPPDTDDIGNPGWWHAAFFAACAPP